MVLQIWRSLLVGAIAAITILVLLGVAARYILNAPLLWTDESSRILLVVMMFIGIAELFRLQNGHVAINVLAKRLGARGAAAMRVVKAVIVITTLAVMIFGGLVLANPDRPSVSAALGIPMWMIYSVIPASGVLSIIFLLIRMLHRNSGEQEKE